MLRTRCSGVGVDWFLGMMARHEEFVVETDQPGEWPMPFWSETVRQVMVE